MDDVWMNVASSLCLLAGAEDGLVSEFTGMIAELTFVSGAPCWSCLSMMMGTREIDLDT